MNHLVEEYAQTFCPTTCYKSVRHEENSLSRDEHGTLVWRQRIVRASHLRAAPVKCIILNWISTIPINVSSRKQGLIIIISFNRVRKIRAKYVRLAIIVCTRCLPTLNMYLLKYTAYNSLISINSIGSILAQNRL